MVGCVNKDVIHVADDPLLVTKDLCHGALKYLAGWTDPEGKAVEAVPSK